MVMELAGNLNWNWWRTRHQLLLDRLIYQLRERFIMAVIFYQHKERVIMAVILQGRKTLPPSLS